MGKDIILAGRTIKRGEKFQDFITIPGTEYRTPVTVINGEGEGKTVLISAGVHGGEYPGVASASVVSSQLEPSGVRGAVIFFNCLNYSGMMSMVDAHVPEDDKNINRAFPGSADGSVTERIKYWVANEVRPQVDFILDLHSGGQFETLSDLIFFPTACGEQMRELTLDISRHMDVNYLVASTARDGLYSYSCHQGTPGIILERSGHGECSKKSIEQGINDINNLLIYFGITEGSFIPVEREQKIFERTNYLTSDEAGFWYPEVQIDEDIDKGQKLGTIKDVFGNMLREYHAEFDATVIYMQGGLIAQKGKTNLVSYSER
ncbi:MAG: succinylglutamate desuccinylase/aspartoacylase family protein [Clostridia bacterium]|nr:succinylglutamate desuccinylase/aspartoacylase family protein [Clostridia bacterium]